MPKFDLEKHLAAIKYDAKLEEVDLSKDRLHENEVWGHDETRPLGIPLKGSEYERLFSVKTKPTPWREANPHCRMETISKGNNYEAVAYFDYADKDTYLGIFRPGEGFPEITPYGDVRRGHAICTDFICINKVVTSLKELPDGRIVVCFGFRDISIYIYQRQHEYPKTSWWHGSFLAPRSAIDFRVLPDGTLLSLTSDNSIDFWQVGFQSRLTLDDITPILNALKKNKAVQRLNLSNTKFDDRGIDSLITLLNTNTTLIEINLYHTWVTVAGIERLQNGTEKRNPKPVIKHISLTIEDWVDKKLNPMVIFNLKKYVDAIKTDRKLTEIDLSQDRIVRNAPKKEANTNQNEYVRLHLSDIMPLLLELQTNQTVQKLNLQNMELEDNDIPFFIDLFKSNCTITEIDFRKTKITSTGIESLQRGIINRGVKLEIHHRFKRTEPEINTDAARNVTDQKTNSALTAAASSLTHAATTSTPVVVIASASSTLKSDEKSVIKTDNESKAESTPPFVSAVSPFVIANLPSEIAPDTLPKKPSTPTPLTAAKNKTAQPKSSAASTGFLVYLNWIIKKVTGGYQVVDQKIVDQLHRLPQQHQQLTVRVQHVDQKLGEMNQVQQTLVRDLPQQQELLAGRLGQVDQTLGEMKVAQQTLTREQQRLRDRLDAIAQQMEQSQSQMFLHLKQLQDEKSVDVTTLRVVCKQERDKQHAALERQRIRNNDKLSDYYYLFIIYFTDIWLACKTIHSGMVDNAEKTNLDHVAEGLDAIGKHIPGISVLTSFAKAVVNAWSSRDKKLAVNRMANFLVGLVDSDALIEALARQLTLAQEKEISAIPTHKPGFFGKALRKAKDFKNWVTANDVDNAIKEFAEEQCKKILTAIMKDELNGLKHPTLKDLDKLMQKILEKTNFHYQSPIPKPETAATTQAETTVQTPSPRTSPSSIPVAQQTQSSAADEVKRFDDKAIKADVDDLKKLVGLCAQATKQQGQHILALQDQFNKKQDQKSLSEQGGDGTVLIFEERNPSDSFKSPLGEDIVSLLYDLQNRVNAHTHGLASMDERQRYVENQVTDLQHRPRQSSCCNLKAPQCAVM